ncbi:unnamed protein product [Clonostachys solani]|uniref:Uncharacterized protein n=1 Tax=Clonostachys solani TaxID=160281 RepID=A0A9N9ZPJ9_9HYPO|nr:unnamed protein product [Clonostachys solani]
MPLLSNCPTSTCCKSQAITTASICPTAHANSWNEEKKKYFKVEKSSTAPSASTWSSDAVKRRKVEHQASEVVRKRDWELRSHIKRHRLWEHTVASGTLKREIRDDLSWEGGDSLKAAAWAGGLEAKGEVRFGSHHRRSGHLPCLWIGGQEQGLETAVAYTSRSSLFQYWDVPRSYIKIVEVVLTGGSAYSGGRRNPVDDDGKLSFREDVPLDSPRRPVRYIESTRCSQMSSISYHQASHRILLTSREPGNPLGLNIFSPPRCRGTEGPWILGEAANHQRISFSRLWRHDHVALNTCKPAPPSLPHLICAIATDSGLVSVATDESVSLITSHNPFRSDRNRNRTHQHTRTPRDVFDLDFHPTNPNIIFSGGRQPRVWIKDTRTPPSEPCRHITHPSSVARLRAISENQLLVCGPQSAMAVYDVRFFPTPQGGGRNDDDNAPPRPRPGPLLAFPEYVNGAHLAVGFDVSPELGIAAAAQDDGTVRLFSLATGRRLACPAMEARGKMGMPIKSLMFQTVPGENSQSLFVGEGLWLRKYSFGTRELDA